MLAPKSTSQMFKPSFDEKDKEIIVQAVEKRSNVFIQGAGGCGKSVLITEIARRLRDCDLNVAITATTGAAAVNIGGTTVHRFAGIGRGTDEAFRLVRKIMSKTKYLERWRETNVLIIDEISMMGADLFDKIEYIGRKVRPGSRETPFGGLQIILSGDFLQLPPIKDGWAFESQAWPTLNLKIFSLKTPKRYDDYDHFAMLLRLREAEATSNDIELLKSRFKAFRDAKGDFSGWEVQPTIIYSYKVDVAAYNEQKLDELSGDAISFSAEDQLVFKGYNSSEEQREYYTKLLTDAIPSIVTLKVGAQVILKKNIDIDAGLVNGSRGVVKTINFTAKTVTVKFHNGVLAPIGRELWEIDDDEAVASRTQIPFILGWASSVHASQGCTLDLGICDVGRSIFSPGQLYVAISRVKNIEGLFLSDFDPCSIYCDEIAKKYVRRIEDHDDLERNTGIEFID